MNPLEYLRDAVPKLGSHPLLPPQVRQALVAALGAFEEQQSRLAELERAVRSLGGPK